MRVVAGCKGKGESGAGKGDKEATRDKNIGKDKDNEKDAGISNKGTKNGHKTNNNSTSSKFKFTFWCQILKINNQETKSWIAVFIQLYSTNNFSTKNN